MFSLNALNEFHGSFERLRLDKLMGCKRLYGTLLVFAFPLFWVSWALSSLHGVEAFKFHCGSKRGCQGSVRISLALVHVGFRV